MPSTMGAVTGIAVFTLGEMIWAPRFLELSVMVSVTSPHDPKHAFGNHCRQAIKDARALVTKYHRDCLAYEVKRLSVIALTGLPKFLSRFIAGASSGILLNRFCRLFC